MSIRTISTALQNKLQQGQLVLTADTLAELPLGNLLSVLQSEVLTFQEATLTALDDTVALSGKAALLGAERVGLTLLFSEAEDSTLTVGFSAQLPIGWVPGAPWLSLEAMQIALEVVGSGKAVIGSLKGTVRSKTTTLTSELKVSQVEGEYGLEWTLETVDLGAIATLFLDGATLPEELPNLAFADVTATIRPSTGAFSLSAASAGAWAFPANGGGLTISEAAFNLERIVAGTGTERTSQIKASVSIQGDESVDIAADFTLNGFGLAFELEGSDWQVQGNVAATLFDESLTLAATYAQQEGVRSLLLSASAPGLRELISLNGSGSFGIMGLALAYSRAVTVPGEPASPAEWSLAAQGRMAVPDVFDFEGTLTLSKTATETSLAFEPETAVVTLPMPASDDATMTLAFGEISFVRRTPTSVIPRSTWVFEASTALSFVGWHSDVQARLPEAINATFRATNNSVRVTADRVLAPFDFELPAIEIDDDLRIALGSARLDVTDLAIGLGQSIELSARIGVGLPSELNNLFGIKENGDPALELFNTFDPTQPDDTTVEVELTINAVGGIRLVPRTAILKAVELVEENGITFWHLDLGDFGAVKFQVPVFGYNASNSSFQTSGGFEVVRPLSLPLTPAKLLLKAAGMDAIANGIPDGIPLRPIAILDDQGNFQTEALVELLEQVSDGDLPDELGDALNTIGDQLERLPSSFRDYLNVQIPESFSFDLAVTPTGEIRLNAQVNEGDPPVRLLYPSFSPLPVPMPALNGVELRRLSLGTLSGGSLFLLQVDAELDQFDLLTLAGSLLIPSDRNLPLPDSRDLHRRLVLNNLFMIIVYQTGIPIPIPLFYDTLAIDYLGLEGINFETRAEFPEPSLNLAEMSEVLSKLKRFFTDRDYLLDPNDPPEDFNLRFTFPLPHNFLQLPEYLGSQKLGSADTGVEIDAYRNLAHLLNGFKTLSLNELIQAVPLEHRVNHVDVSFGPLSMGAGWLVTTPGEFQQLAAHPADRQRVYDQMGFTSDEAATAAFAIAPLPATAEPTQAEGLVALLRGNCNLANIASLDAVFGLAASGPQGFSTGFRIAGNITHVLDLELAGLVAINSPNPTTPTTTDAFRLAGHSHLTLLNHRIFTGDVQILNDTFQLSGALSLFPANSPLQINGQLSGLISPSQFYLSGDVSTSLAGFELVGTKALLDNQRLFVQGSWLGVTTTLDVTARGQTVILQGQVDVDLWGLQANLGIDIDTAQGAIVKGQVQGINLLNGAFRLSGANGQPNPSVLLQVGPNLPLTANLSGAVSLLGFTSETAISVSQNEFSFQTQGNAFNLFQCSVSAQGRRLSSTADFRLSGQFQNDLLTYLKTEATRVIEGTVSEATAKLTAAQADVQQAQNKVDTLNREINAMQQTIQAERSRDTQRLQDARAKVSQAQNEVDSIQSEINRTYARINQLNQDIRDKKRWYDNSPKLKKTYRWAEYSAYAAAKGTEISGLYTKIGGLETGKGTANGVLELAKRTLQGIEAGAQTFPIEADPRMAGLITAREAATGSLAIARKTLGVTQTTVGALGDVSTYIIRNGIGNVLDVRSARFDLALDTVKNGQMQLNLDLVYLSDRKSLSLLFDFNNPLASAQALAKKLLPA